MDLSLKDMLVFANDEVDVEASVAKFRAACETISSKHKNDLEVVKGAVNAIFDQYPSQKNGKGINERALRTLVCSRLNVHPNAMDEIGDRAMAFVKANEGTLFSRDKGIRGGIKRLSDLATAEAAAAATATPAENPATLPS